MKPEAFKAIIARAIDSEIEAYGYYHNVSEKVQDPNMKRIFSELADDEGGHREFLERIMHKGSNVLSIDETADYRIAETLEVPPLTMDLKPVDGISLAIRKELDAMQMYTRLSQIATDPDERKVFLELAKMEKGHKARLEDIYTNMAFPEVW
jgi:rubrerythrin